MPLDDDSKLSEYSDDFRVKRTLNMRFWTNRV